MPEYVFKPNPEFFWAVLIAGVISVLQMLVGFDPLAVENWRLWAITLGGAFARAAIGAALAMMTSKRVTS